MTGRRDFREFAPDSPVVYDILRRQHRNTVDKAFQHADIARPAEFLQRAHRLRRKHFQRAGRKKEMLHQRRDILFPVAQRRHIDRHDIQAVKQVLPELLLR